MDITISPNLLSGRVTAIASKSEAHRLLICAALADTACTITIAEINEDVAATISCLRELGAKITFMGQNSLLVSPIVDAYAKQAVLDCGESGSTLRFLLPVAAALGADANFYGSGRLPERPLQPLMSQLREHGIRYDFDTLPLKIRGRLNGGDFALAGDISSQFFTGILLALPLAGGGTVQALTKLQSKSYVDITLDAMRKFGVKVTEHDGKYTVPKGKYVSCGNVATGGDWSNAAFWLCSGALGGPVTVGGLDLASAQGDRIILDILSRFGAKVLIENGNVTVSGDKLTATDIDASDIPDLIPPLAIVAAAAEGETKIYNAGRLRLKESDRISAIAHNLSALGADVCTDKDSLTIRGGKPLSGGAVDGFNDHRIIMSAAIASQLCTSPLTISGFNAVRKSYPEFFSDMKALGGAFDVK